MSAAFQIPPRECPCGRYSRPGLLQCSKCHGRGRKSDAVEVGIRVYGLTLRQAQAINWQWFARSIPEAQELLLNMAKKG